MALIDLLPPLLFAILLPMFIVKMVSFTEKSQRLAPFELVFFSLTGLVVAYLTNLSAETILEGLLPSFVVLLAFFFQLFGRTQAAAKVPLGSKISFSAGAMAIVSFLVSLRYFELAFGTSSQG